MWKTAVVDDVPEVLISVRVKPPVVPGSKRYLIAKIQQNKYHPRFVLSGSQFSWSSPSSFSAYVLH